jgi:hypothetical protein
MLPPVKIATEVELPPPFSKKLGLVLPMTRIWGSTLSWRARSTEHKSVIFMYVTKGMGTHAEDGTHETASAVLTIGTEPTARAT